MCVLAFAWQANPRWKLALAGNRDEDHERPSDPMAPWIDHLHLVAGRDRRSGGTWLGVSTEGRMAVVTNLRGGGPPDPGAPSRGMLVADILKGEGVFADPQRGDLAAFSPFNLIAVRQDRAELMGNRPEPFVRALEPGVYGLSNGALDEPWPKTLRLKAALSLWLAWPSSPDALLAALTDETREPEDPPQASIFIRNPRYGTRCSTVVLIDQDNRGLIIERRFDPEGRAAGDTRIGFAWP